MAKEVFFGKDATDQMVKGLDTVANAVGGTLGPKGRNVFIDGDFGPEMTNDGFTIASRMILADQLQDKGAYLVRNTTGQTNDDVGDGTTTTAVLLQAIIHECFKRPENAMDIMYSLKAAGEKALKILAKSSVKIEKEDVKKVALISGENESLAAILHTIIQKLGDKAIINVEDSKTFATEYEITDGYEAKAGLISDHFADKTTGKFILEDVPVLVTSKRISQQADITPIFEKFQTAGITKCVIVCDDIDSSMVGLFALNKMSGRFNVAVIRASGDTLQDIEGATGATMISDESGITFQNIELKNLGHVKKIISDSHKTLFMGSNGIKAKLRAKELEKRVEDEPNQFLQKIIRERAARMRGSIAILKIGAPTDVERVYLKRKAEDAVKAVQAALEEGVVEGGAMALWRIAREIGEKTIGEQILRKALVAPLRKIIENAGKDYAEIISRMPIDCGYNAKEDTYSRLIEEGIIDPAKVERCALENAVSAAATFITMFCATTEYVQPENK